MIGIYIYILLLYYIYIYIIIIVVLVFIIIIVVVVIIIYYYYNIYVDTGIYEPTNKQTNTKHLEGIKFWIPRLSQRRPTSQVSISVFS